MTEPGQRKKLYIDTIGCSQGFSEQLSVLGLDLWAVIMDRIQGQGIMPAGEGGYLINVHGKQYFDVSNMLKGMGNRLAVLTLKSLDPIIRERKDDIIREYKALKRTKAMQQSKIAMLRIAFSSIPTMLKMFASPQKQHQKYVKLSNLVIGEIKSLPQNKPFDQLVQDGISILDPIIRNAVAYIPGQLAMGRIKRMFKNVGLENEISAICMDLASNPTAVMGKALFQLACDPAVKGTSEVKEFEQKIQNRSYSQSFLKKYDHYVYFYGDRCFKEIDIATSRVRHNPGALYKQLININTNDSQISKAVERKEAAYQRLRKEAERMGKTKKFAKNVALYENLFGFREMPKYLTVVLTGRLHEIAMEIGNEFLKEGRLESAEQIFELHLNEIAKALKDKGLELMPLIQANIAQYKKAYHRIKWPTNIDSRGKIFYPTIKENEGSFSGQAISSGIVTGKAKVLTSPYEKSLLPGEILVTITAEPAWTPIFINAAGIVLEVGGLLHHGAIIAREYGIPCVSGLRDATSIIKDGDLIEVDGTNGFVKIIE
jgi:pyruvate,water dikinase